MDQSVSGSCYSLKSRCYFRMRAKAQRESGVVQSGRECNTVGDSKKFGSMQVSGLSVTMCTLNLRVIRQK